MDSQHSMQVCIIGIQLVPKGNNIHAKVWHLPFSSMTFTKYRTTTKPSSGGPNFQFFQFGKLDLAVE